jgi:hypothetical protein
MVDYHKATGSTGDMMIRDTGTLVEFWLNSNNSTTSNSALPWGWTDAGGTSPVKYYDYNANSGWQKLRSFSVTSDETVTFRIYDTGTSGFGGPTALTVTIDRASVPNPPAITLSNVTSTTVDVKITDGLTNGAAIDARQIAYSRSNSTAGASTVSSDGTTTVTGLISGSTHFFWARTHNSKGWSGYSPVKSVFVPTVPGSPGPPIISDPTQTHFWVSFIGGDAGGLPNLEWQVGYSLTNNVATATWVTYTADTPRTIEGLQPASTYYVWTRGRNAAGFGPPSEMSFCNSERSRERGSPIRECQWRVETCSSLGS